MDRNDLLSIAQRLREYVGNPHHIDPISQAFKQLIVEASESLSQVAALQSTIARLEARVAELESGRGEPVAWKFKERVWATGLSDYVWRDQLEDEKPNGDERQIRDIDPLFTAPPAPVAHTMKSVMSAVCAITGFPMLTSNQCHVLAQALNARLDATAALNGPAK